MATTKTEPWLQKSQIELKTYVKDRGEKFIDAESRKSDDTAFLMHTTEPVYVKFIKFATDKFQNIKTRHWDSRLSQRRNEVREKFLSPLENAIRDGLREWKTSEEERKLMEAASTSVVNIFMKLSLTKGKNSSPASMFPCYSGGNTQRPLSKGNSSSSAQWQPIEWKPIEWKPIEWYGGSSASETTRSTSGTGRSQVTHRNYMNRRSSQSEYESEFDLRVDYVDGNTFQFGFGRRF